MAVTKSANVIKCTAVNDVDTRTLKIMGILWVGEDTFQITDSMVLVDNNGNIIYGKRAPSSIEQTNIMFPFLLPVNGIKVSTLDGGVLYIYHK